MRIAGYFHEIDNWCPPEVYPLHLERLSVKEAEDRFVGGFVCSPYFEARAVIMNLTPSSVVPVRPLEDGDELLVMRDLSVAYGQPTRHWWLVTRAEKRP